MACPGQAIGSIIAIFASAGLVWWQHNLQQKASNDAAKQRVRKFINAGLSIANLAEKELWTVYEEGWQDQVSQVNIGETASMARLVHAAKGLDEVPAFEIYNARITNAITYIRSCTAALISSQRKGFTITGRWYFPAPLSPDDAANLCYEVGSMVADIERELKRF